MRTDTARKSIKQNYQLQSTELKNLMTTFRYMVNHCIRIGKENNCSTLKRLSILSYHELVEYHIPSYYKLCAISKATGILSSMKKSIKRGIIVKSPYMKKDMLVSCYSFKINLDKQILKFPIGNRRYLAIPLNNHTISMIQSEPCIKVRSFLITENSLSLCIAKQVGIPDTMENVIGVDRNLENVAFGNQNQVTLFNTSKTVKIAQTTKQITSSFKRNDVKIRKQIYSKYGARRKARVNNILHRISKVIVQKAKQTGNAIVFEDITNIRNLYKKGNWQGKNHRGKMNGWSFAEVKRQIEYKAQWEGVPVIQLTKKETRGTSSLCYICGERLRSSREYGRNLWCENCKKSFDRDVVAVMNISYRGLLRFGSSQGLADEAMVQESGTPLILKVDASKLLEVENLP